jgi:hypothetical protein
VNVQFFCTLYIVQSINHLYVACRPEPESVRGAQESIPRNQFRQAGNRFLGSLKSLRIRALYNVGNRNIHCKHLFSDVKKKICSESFKNFLVYLNYAYAT